MPEANNKLDRKFLNSTRGLKHLKTDSNEQIVNEIKSILSTYRIKTPISMLDHKFLKDLEDNKHLEGLSPEAIAIADNICKDLKINHLPIPPSTVSLKDSNTLLPIKPVETFLLKAPVQPKDILPELIICAAAKDPNNNKVFLSVRHCDEMFTQQVDSDPSYDDTKYFHHFEQGFYTNKRRFLSREEAYTIAYENNQIKRLCPTNSNRLYSEMLY